MPAFDTCLAEILKWEGGWSNNPHDPGGETMLGVTRKTWQAYTGKPETDMRSLTVAKVAPLYRKQYWDVVCGEQLPPAMAMCAFDMAVNAGPSRAARYLQKLVNASPDGQVGTATLCALQAFVTAHGLAEAVRGYQQSRRAYYHQLGTFDTFGRGWLRRVDGVETAALRLIK